MWLGVQVLAADRAESGAVRPAENLQRQRQRDRIAGPGREIEPVVLQVRRPQLVGVGVCRLILTGRDRQLEHGVFEAAVAGAVEPVPEAKLEDGPRARTRDRQLRLHGLGHRQIALPAELQRLELNLSLVGELLAGAELERA